MARVIQAADAVEDDMRVSSLFPFPFAFAALVLAGCGGDASEAVKRSIDGKSSNADNGEAGGTANRSIDGDSSDSGGEDAGASNQTGTNDGTRPNQAPE